MIRESAGPPPRSTELSTKEAAHERLRPDTREAFQHNIHAEFAGAGPTTKGGSKLPRTK